MESTLFDKEDVLYSNQKKVDHLLKELRQFIKKNDLQLLSGEHQQIISKTINRKISDTYLVINDLESDLNAHSSTSHIQLKKHLKKYRHEIEQLERSLIFKQVGKKHCSSLSHICKNSKQFSIDNSLSQIDNKQPATEYGTLDIYHCDSVLNRTNKSVDRTNLVAEENERIGNEILNILVTQRNQLSSTRDTFKDSKIVSLGKSKDTSLSTCLPLKHSLRFLFCNPVLPLFLIFVELGIMCYVIYYRFIHK